MIKFYCRGCGVELWQGYFDLVKQGNYLSDTIGELWNALWCSDCCMKGLNRKEG